MHDHVTAVLEALPALPAHVSVISGLEVVECPRGNLLVVKCAYESSGDVSSPRYGACIKIFSPWLATFFGVTAVLPRRLSPPGQITHFAACPRIRARSQQRKRHAVLFLAQ